MKSMYPSLYDVHQKLCRNAEVCNYVVEMKNTVSFGCQNVKLSSLSQEECIDNEDILHRPPHAHLQLNFDHLPVKRHWR